MTCGEMLRESLSSESRVNSLKSLRESKLFEAYLLKTTRNAEKLYKVMNEYLEIVEQPQNSNADGSVLAIITGWLNPVKGVLDVVDRFRGYREKQLKDRGDYAKSFYERITWKNRWDVIETPPK